MNRINWHKWHPKFSCFILGFWFWVPSILKFSRCHSCRFIQWTYQVPNPSYQTLKVLHVTHSTFSFQSWRFNQFDFILNRRNQTLSLPQDIFQVSSLREVEWSQTFAVFYSPKQIITTCTAQLKDCIMYVACIWLFKQLQFPFPQSVSSKQLIITRYSISISMR